VAAGALAFGLGLGAYATADELAKGKEALASGRYEDAIQAFRSHIDGRGVEVEAYRGLIEALRETGRYEDAERSIKDYQEARPGSSELENVLGEVLYETGRIDAAREAYERSVKGGASDRLTAELNLAVLRYEQGERDEAMRGFDRFIDVYNLSPQLTSEALTMVGTACRYLGANDPQLFKDALKAYDEAIVADGDNLEARIRVSELFLEKYNSPDAHQSYKEILAINPNQPRALLGLARVLQFDGSPEALALTVKALEVNPNLVAAHVFMGRLLLDLESYEEAAKEAEKALEVNPVSLEALTLLAASRFLRGDQPGFEEARRRALGRNPRYADFYNTLADVCVRNRLYHEAVDFSRQAVELDDRSALGFGLLGLNQLRLGEIEEGRRNLERSFAGDPYNVWIKNTLDLLDTFPGYEETKSERFAAFVEGKESDLLAPYVVSLMEEAYESLSKRYQYRAPTPIRIEVYPSHADFSVRTIGLAGLGALGVCFGPVVAIDSPSSREKGDFNWGSTLWHELTHSVTLGITDHKIPRWFSEGLSVFEERRARPGWGDDVNIGFLMAHKEKKLLPVSELNNGFIRPTFPQQITISYYQASLICELIEKEYGFDAVLRMLAGYREGRGTAEIFRDVLACDPSCFDEKLETYINDRFQKALAALPESSEEMPSQPLSPADVKKRAEEAPDDFIAQMAMGALLFQEEKFEEALPYLKRAKALFPEYGGKDGPYWLLAQIYKADGDEQKAREELAALVAINEGHYDAHMELAELNMKLGERKAAAEILERAIYIYPFEQPLHRHLAELYRELGEPQRVIDERKAVAALEVVDRAQVLYDLALAYYEAGDPAGARREVLRALEIAPGFDEALELLLQLQPGDKGEDS
jgi:tetratricopeptide (TPR) repeat protein